MCNWGFLFLDNMGSVVPTKNGDSLGRTSYLYKTRTLSHIKHVSSKNDIPKFIENAYMRMQPTRRIIKNDSYTPIHDQLKDDAILSRGMKDRKDLLPFRRHKHTV